VVVAIIALLISILLPSLERARAAARQTLCLTNMRTIGQSAHMYRDENKDWGIRGIAGFGAGGPPEYHIFWTSILRYVTPDMKYVLEDDPLPGESETHANHNFDKLWEYHISHIPGGAPGPGNGTDRRHGLSRYRTRTRLRRQRFSDQVHAGVG
jgi:hypothetical protein